MARRKKNGLTLSSETLERARQNAGNESEKKDELAEAEEALNGEMSINERSARRRKAAPAQLERSRQRGELTGEMIEDLLANPTITVSEEALREEYSHVLVDLRNMGVLAALLVAIIVGLSYIL